ncbi:unnamed protein product [Pseudo-nitzschia multistriata]|uniref:Uncharacterized protein n=1 Tax=Pseudo-nitzschia multistriata TaxID=183589 RepID=A0A448Z6F4_9STRA|nr:unnamed protein product [Pseudo-nitzschia multistriata]
MHRKLLRRRHVRKLQKSKERERQRKEEEERQKELTRDLDRKRRAEKRRSLRQRGKTSQTKSNAKRKLYSTGFKGIENPITLPVPLHGNSYKTGTINHNNNSCNSVLLHYLSSPTSVLGLHRTIVSTPTKYSPQAISHRSNAMMTVLSAGSRSIEMAFPRQASFSLPEFSPVRPTKFRKLQL